MKRILHFVSLLFISINLFAQAPQKMTYQAVIRNSSNNLVVSSPVKMKISILQGSATGTSVYSEEHNPTTNANGLVSIVIGEGTNKTGTFSTIDWGNGTYFLKTETDPTNGNNLSIVGTSQLLSVPYALHSGNGVKGVSTSGDTLFLDNGKKFLIPGIKDLNAPSTLNNGLVAFYPFNGNANDESGNGNNGIVNGATLITDRFGVTGKAYGFQSTNISVPMTSLLHNIPVRSFSVWFYANGPQNGGRIYETTYLNGGIGLYNNNILDAWYYNGQYETNVTNVNTGEINKWHHLVYIANSNTGLGQIYLDGVLTASRNGAILSPPAPQNWQNNFMRFGIGASGESFNGRIDDIRIYNRALTQDEITWLANN